MAYCTRALQRLVRSLNLRSTADMYDRAADNPPSSQSVLCNDDSDVYEVERLVSCRRKVCHLFMFIARAHTHVRNYLFLGWSRIPSTMGGVPEGRGYMGKRRGHNTARTSVGVACTT